MYCEDTSHKANECSEVTTASDRKQVLAKRRLCFNCAAGNHKAAECPSKSTCQRHTSICDHRDKPTKKEKAYTAGDNTNDEGIFPIVTVRVGGVLCRTLIDSGAGSSMSQPN